MTWPTDSDLDTADEFRDQLGLYVLHRLPPPEVPALESHLRRCLACRRELRRLAPLPAALGALDDAGRAALLLAEAVPAPAVEPDAELRRELAALGVDAVALFRPAGDVRPASKKYADAGSPGPAPDLIDRIMETASGGAADGPVGADTRAAPGAERPDAAVPIHRRRRGRVLRWATPTAAAIAAAAAIGVVAVQETAGPALQSATAALAPPHSGQRPISGHLVLTPTGSGSRVSLRIDGAVPGTHCLLLLLTRTGARQQVTTWVADNSGRTQLTANTTLAPNAVPGAVVETTDHRVLLQGTVSGA